MDSKDINEYLLDLSKIVEGALGSDRDKVIAYAGQLKDRLLRDGFADAARRFDQLLRNGAAKGVGLAKATGVGTRLPVDSESRLPTADVEMLRPEDSEVFLTEESTVLVARFLSFVRASDRLFAEGVGVSASMLIHGPSGCGKTQLARHIASQLELPLVTARSDTLISSYLGSTSKNIRALFEHAMSRPCVLFLDEFDALAKMRDDSRELGELKRVVISLLQNIDSMRGDHVLIAATNHPHLLDAAIWRRFAYRLELAPPLDVARQQIMQRTLRGFADKSTLDILVPLTAGLSGADCKSLAEDAVRSAIVGGRSVVETRELVEWVLARRTGTTGSTHPLGEKLQTLRALLPPSVSQTQLGELMGVSQSQVSKLLKGTANAR
jgi:SpoVK/Ycf46/Vps4 family AAA+-type ATPase